MLLKVDNPETLMEVLIVARFALQDHPTLSAESKAQLSELTYLINRLENRRREEEATVVRCDYCDEMVTALYDDSGPTVKVRWIHLVSRQAKCYPSEPVAHPKDV